MDSDILRESRLQPQPACCTPLLDAAEAGTRLDAPSKSKGATDFGVITRAEHYNSHPSGVECIDVIKHMTFCQGTAVKYLWRMGMKGDPVEDLRKAIQNCEYEIARIEGEGGS